MKLKLKYFSKIYLLLFIYLILSTLKYSFNINNTYNDFNLIIKLILTGSAYFMLGFLYTNIIHKKGLIIAILVGIIHYSLIQVISFLMNNDFNFQILPFFIYMISTIAGGLLGVNLKKLF